MSNKILLFNSERPDGAVISERAYKLWLMRASHEERETHTWAYIDEEGAEEVEEALTVTLSIGAQNVPFDAA
jgi:hypothetical protein